MTRTEEQGGGAERAAPLVWPSPGAGLAARVAWAARSPPRVHAGRVRAVPWPRERRLPRLCPGCGSGGTEVRQRLARAAPELLSTGVCGGESSVKGQAGAGGCGVGGCW